MKQKYKTTPVNLLKSIKILIQKPERPKYPFESITEAFKRIVNMKQ